MRSIYITAHSRAVIRNGLTALGLHLRLLGKNYLELVCDFFAVVERSSHQQLTVVMNRTIVTVSRFPEVQTIRRILWVSILIRRIVEGGVSFFCCWEGPALRPEDPKLVRFARLTSSRQVGWPSARLARRLANSHVGELGDVPYRLVVLSRGKKVPLHNSNVRGAMDVLVFFILQLYVWGAGQRRETSRACLSFPGGATNPDQHGGGGRAGQAMLENISHHRQIRYLFMIFAFQGRC